MEKLWHAHHFKHPKHSLKVSPTENNQNSLAILHTHTSVNCERKLIESNKDFCGAESCLSITHEAVNQTFTEGEFEDKVNLIFVIEFLTLFFFLLRCQTGFET